MRPQQRPDYRLMLWHKKHSLPISSYLFDEYSLTRDLSTSDAQTFPQRHFNAYQCVAFSSVYCRTQQTYPRKHGPQLLAYGTIFSKLQHTSRLWAISNHKTVIGGSRRACNAVTAQLVTVSRTDQYVSWGASKMAGRRGSSGCNWRS